MFKTLVMLCAASGHCIVLEDTEGPYFTKTECVERAYEIAQDVQEETNIYFSLKYKCEKSNKINALHLSR